MDGGAWYAAVHGVTKSWDVTERLHFHFSLSCIGEGNSNPLQCSCLENPRDGGAYWATVYGVTQSRTRLKWLSSSSSSSSSLDGPCFWYQSQVLVLIHTEFFDVNVNPTKCFRKFALEFWTMGENKISIACIPEMTFPVHFWFLCVFMCVCVCVCVCMTEREREIHLYVVLNYFFC